MRQASLQAGLFGGAITIILGLIALLPYVGLCIALPLYPLAFFVAGLAAVRVMDYPPTVGEAIQAGAAAGLLAGVVGGLAAMFLAPVRLSIAGGPETAAQSLSPETIEGLIGRGLDPLAVMDFLAGVGAGMFCCALQIFGGVLLAAAAAAMYAAYRQA